MGQIFSTNEPLFKSYSYAVEAINEKEVIDIDKAVKALITFRNFYYSTIEERDGDVTEKLEMLNQLLEKSDHSIINSEFFEISRLYILRIENHRYKWGNVDEIIKAICSEIIENIGIRSIEIADSFTFSKRPHIITSADKKLLSILFNPNNDDSTFRRLSKSNTEQAIRLLLINTSRLFQTLIWHYTEGRKTPHMRFTKLSFCLKNTKTIAEKYLQEKQNKIPFTMDDKITNLSNQLEALKANVENQKIITSKTVSTISKISQETKEKKASNEKYPLSEDEKKYLLRDIVMHGYTIELFEYLDIIERIYSINDKINKELYSSIIYLISKKCYLIRDPERWTIKQTKDFFEKYWGIRSSYRRHECSDLMESLEKDVVYKIFESNITPSNCKSKLAIFKKYAPPKK